MPCACFQSDIERRKQGEERLEKRLAEVDTENRRMREPLQVAKRETEEFRRRMENCEKDKALLAVKRCFSALVSTIARCV